MKAPLLALLLVSPCAARAASECAPLDSQTCWYAGKGAVQSGAAAALVYFRGHWGEHKGSVPPGLRAASARQAFEKYGLKRAADENGAVVLVTGSSDVAVDEAALERLAQASGARFAKRWLASHSGGFVGLGVSLKKLGPVDRIVLLDTFYFGEDLSKSVAGRVAAGAQCTGFLTPHNKERWKTRFAPHVDARRCPLDNYLGAGEHEDAVPRCLSPYLSRTTCL